MKDVLDIALEPTRWLILNHLKRAPHGCSFIWLKDTMSLSDGNLGAHMRTLKRYRLVKIEKKFQKRMPITIFRLSEQGSAMIPKVLSFVNDACFDELEKKLITKVAESDVVV